MPWRKAGQQSRAPQAIERPAVKDALQAAQAVFIRAGISNELIEAKSGN